MIPNLTSAAAQRPQRLQILVLGVLLTVGAACEDGGSARPEREPTTVYDLIAEFDDAKISRRTRLIRFRDPSSERHLLAGWLRPPRRPDRQEGGNVWSDRLAEIEFFAETSASTQVRFRCAPNLIGDPGPHRLELSINDVRWTSVELENRWHEYRLDTPPELIREGRNLLQIRHRSGSDAPESDAVDKLVQWAFIRFGGDDAPPSLEPQVRADRKQLFIPPGVKVDYYLELPAGSYLSIAQIRSRTPTRRLQITWKELDGPEQLIGDFESILKFESTVLSNAESTRGRLRFATAGLPAGADQPGGVFVRGPVIHAVGARDMQARTAAAGPEPARPATKPNIIVYLVDTLRADHLGAYGYGRNVSPRIDAFADDACLFESAQAQSPWTRASVASVFTGQLPQVHGANDDDEGLAPEAVTIAELLRDMGYHTALITANGNAGPGAGFQQGFTYFRHIRLGRAHEVHAEVLRWLETYGDEQPFFIYIHTIDPHAPYQPPEPFRSRFAAEVGDPSLGSMASIQKLERSREPVPRETVEQITALYDAEVAANDHAFGLLLDELEVRGLYRDAMIFFLSDHGEEFYDHGRWTHGKTLYGEMLNTPLILRLPGQTAGCRLPDLAEHVAILPTILDYLGASSPANIQGTSLLPLIRNQAAVTNRRAISHLNLRGREITSLISGRWKIIRQRHRGEDRYPELFDLEDDPEESRNLGPERRDLAHYLASELSKEEKRLRRTFVPSHVDTSHKELRRELKALGYVE